MSMSQPGFFDLDERYAVLSKEGDPLERLNAVVKWRVFKPLIDKAFTRQRRSPAGRKPYDRLMMFKLLILQSLYNLSDHQLEYQVRDRLSFMRFLGLTLDDQVPDKNTLWDFREVLVQGGVMKKLFARFERYLSAQGFDAQAGMLVDASIVEVPKQRNTREENAEIKKGETPEAFNAHKAKGRQKDVHARWTMKGGTSYYGYKDHVHVDAKHKLIRAYEVTSASVGDVRCLGRLIHGVRNGTRCLWADVAYASDRTDRLLKRYQIENRVMHRVKVGGWLPEPQARENKRRAKIRKRVEHVFGHMTNSLGGKFIRTIGLARAQMKIGMMNLAYNINRYEQLCRCGAT